MNRVLLVIMSVLPIMTLSLLPKAATAEVVTSSVVSRTPMTIADRFDDYRRDRDDWRDRDYRRDIDYRRDNDRRRDVDYRRDRDYRRERTFQVWIPGHYEAGFLGIGRRWVPGHYETRDYRR